MRRFALTLLIIGMFAASVAHAQIIFPGTPTMDIEMDPSFPSGEDFVTFTAQSVSFDLQRANITWYVDNELHSEGPALTSISLILGPIGTQTTVTAVAEGIEGTSRADRTVTPAAVDLFWEARSYAPPFYRGRPLSSPRSTIVAGTIVRMVRPDGTRLASSDIIYTWRRNGTVVVSASGRGKVAATFPAPTLFGQDSLSVEAESLDGSLVASASAIIPSHDPGVTLYQDHPLFGILFHNAIPREAVFPESEAAFVAIPYFAAVTSSDDPGFSYDWNVNGIYIPPDPQRPSRLVINAENSDGIANLELAISHAQDIFLSIRDTWRLSFDSRGIFGAPANAEGPGPSPFGTPQ